MTMDNELITSAKSDNESFEDSLFDSSNHDMLTPLKKAEHTCSPSLARQDTASTIRAYDLISEE